MLLYKGPYSLLENSPSPIRPESSNGRVYPAEDDVGRHVAAVVFSKQCNQLQNEFAFFKSTVFLVLLRRTVHGSQRGTS